MAEFSSCSKDGMAHKAGNIIYPFTEKCLPLPALSYQRNVIFEHCFQKLTIQLSRKIYISNT